MEAPEAISNAEKVEKLPWALAGDFANIVHYYLTFAPTILLLFLDKLGLDKTQIGILLSIFTFVDLLALFILPVAARVGYKKVFLIFWAGRKLTIAGMIAAPWVLQTTNVRVTFLFVAAVIVVFSLCRTIAIVAFSPWSQEFIPPNIRGKYAAVQNVVVVVSAVLTTSLTGWWLGADPDKQRFLILFGIALGFGLLSTVFYARVPGGASEPDQAGKPFAGFDKFRDASRDRKLWTFEAGGGIVTVGWGLMAGFLALFYKEQAGLQPSQVFYLDSAMLGASLVSCFLWGWAADRYGSKPVMVLNLAMLAAYPLGLLFLPLNSSLTFPLAMGLVSFVGLVNSGWSIGYGRYFYVNLVPSTNRPGYIGIHTAFIGVLSGATPLVAGAILDRTRDLTGGGWGPVTVNPWTPLFIAAVVGVALSVFVMGRLPAARGEMPVSRFAAMFFRGNPLAAMQQLIAYEMGGQEQKRVATIEKLGQTRSPFSIDQLVEGLRDPSFNVRYEAVISIARTAPDPRLIEAMVAVVRGDEPELALAAAWGLGRMGDASAIPPLRQALGSHFPLLRARAARALGMLRDKGAAPLLLSHFRYETDPALRLAYASALGSMGHAEAMPAMLDFMRDLKVERLRLEVALAVASVLGEDDRAVKLWRRMNVDPGDALAGVVLGLRRRVASLVPDLPPGNETLHRVVERCARAFGSKDMVKGVGELRVLAAAVDPRVLTPPAAVVLWEAIAGIDDHGPERMEYVTLCVHALHVGLDAGAAEAVATQVTQRRALSQEIVTRPFGPATEAI